MPSFQEWHEIVDKMPSLQKWLSQLAVDTSISVWVDGQRFDGFVSETDDPRVLCLADTRELVREDFISQQAYEQAKEAQGTPIHAVIGYYRIDVYSVRLAHRSPHAPDLNTYGGNNQFLREHAR